MVWWGCGTVPFPPCGVVGVWLYICHSHVFSPGGCRLLGQMPICSLISRIFFCRRNRVAADRLLEPPQAPEAPEGTPSSTSSSTSVDSRGTLRLGQIEREVLWVLPTPTGCFFGHEGLQPPPCTQDLRWYCIWDIPGVGRWRIAGVHWGVGVKAYAAILHLHRGEFKGIAFRRFDTREEAVCAFEEEAHKWDLSPRLSQRVFGWTFNHDLSDDSAARN